LKYDVLWKSEWKKLTKFMTIAISIPLIFVFITRFFSNDMSLEITFEHISILELPLFFGGIVAFSGFFSFLIALYIKVCAVVVENGKLIGRNYWCLKREIPISKIRNISPFSNNGIEALVADGGVHGSVYIPIRTAKLQELLNHLKEEGANIDA
jgi:hypothetical protein